MIRSSLKALSFALLLFSIAGCAATTASLKYKDLDVQNRMSDTIFLEPVSADKKTVYIEIRNTSDQDLDLSAVPSMIAAKGYRIVSDPAEAQYLLQANVLYVGKASQAAIDAVTGAGFGGPLAGAAIGAGAGAVIGGSSTAAGIGALVGGLLGAAVETTSGASTKVVTYTAITDVQVSERSTAPIAQEQTTTLNQGTQTRVHQQISETSSWKRYRARISSTATKVNLAFEEAKPGLVRGLTKVLAGIF
jgi:outer membrane lipoprotein SlyB